VFEFRNTWDALGQIATRRHPEGTLIRWQRDARGFLTSIETPLGADASQIRWTPEGRVASWVAPGGVVHERRFDETTRLLREISVAGPAAPAALQLRYAYDASDRIVQSLDLAESLRSQSFDYDALGRLLASTRHEAGQWIRRAQTYDAIGNLTCRDATANACAGGTAYVYPVDALGRARNHLPSAIGGAALAHDAGGRTRDFGDRRFEYDALGRLVRARASAAGATQLAAEYDAGGTMWRLSTPAGGAELLFGDFDWSETTDTARIHVELDGVRIATHASAFRPVPLTRCT
jgi:YD repeat-containing protein